MVRLRNNTADQCIRGGKPLIRAPAARDMHASTGFTLPSSYQNKQKAFR
jgi:hypothetical protein